MSYEGLKRYEDLKGYKGLKARILGANHVKELMDLQYEITASDLPDERKTDLRLHVRARAGNLPE